MQGRAPHQALDGLMSSVQPHRASLDLPAQGALHSNRWSREALAELAADRGERPVEAGVEVGAAGLVGAVKDFVDHGDHPFRLVRGRREAVAGRWRAP